MTAPLRAVSTLSAIVGLSAALAAQAGPQYPDTRAVDHVDTYHGAQGAPIPYRWLEDDTSAETARVGRGAEQGHVRVSRQDSVPRAADHAAAARSTTTPSTRRRRARASTTSSRRTTACRTRACSTSRRGSNGTPEVLIDPNTWSERRHGAPDGRSRRRRTASSPSTACRAAARTGRSTTCSIWRRASRSADKIEWVKVSGVAWRGNGFYYSRYPAAGEGQGAVVDQRGPQVYYHRIGTPQSADELVFEDPKNPQRFHTLSTTEDERFAVLDVSDRGTGKQGNAVFVQDLSKPGAKFTPLIPDDRRRHLQRARERARRAAGLHRQRRAERPRRAHRSREARRRRTGR